MKAIFLTKDPEFRAEYKDVDEKSLPEGDVTVRIEHSTINYKDALALTNTSPIVRQWPMVAGIDFAARWIAARTRWYVPQRQMFVIAASIASSLGSGFLASSAVAAMIWPDWQ